MNFIKKVTAFAAAAVCAASCFAISNNNYIFSEEITTYTVVFLDYEGNPMHSLEVESGAAIDYSSIDTSQLNLHINDYTQRRFYKWDITPEFITEDTEIHALYQEATLSIDSEPNRKEYYSDKGDISLDGLAITITITTQTNEIIDDEYVLDTETINITDACTAFPSTLSEAFADKNSAVISVYPPSGDTEQNRPLLTYTIVNLSNLGDTDENEIVDPVDATNALIHYSFESMNSGGTLTAEQANLADIDRNGKVDVVDATKMLQYYSMKSLDNTMDWEKFFFSAE